MDPVPHSQISPVFALALATSLAAQTTERGRLSGWVEDVGGGRVPGAEVVLLSRPLPARVDVGDADHIEARTDEGGFFRVELLRGRAYSAWATWRSADGAVHRTAVAEGVIPGPPRGLLQDAPQTVRSVRIAGLGPWRHRGPLRVLVRAAMDNPLVVDLETDARGVAELPVLPGEHFDLEMRAADGVLLRAELDLELTRETELPIELPPPRVHGLSVFDEAGDPVAGAEVFACHNYAMGAYTPSIAPSPLGRTDAQGSLTTELPARGTLGHGEATTPAIFLVQAPGYARVLVEDPIVVVLPKGPLLRGRIVDGKGDPVPGLTLLPQAYARPQDKDTAGFGVHPLPLPTDAEGRFSFPGLHSRYGYRLLALLDAERAVQLGMRVDPDLSLAPVHWLAVGEPPFQAVEDLGDLRLDRLAVARVLVREHHGAPAPGAKLLVTGGGSYNSPLDYVTDRVGRLQFPLPAGEVRVGAFVPGGGVATALLRIPPGPDDPPIDPMELRLTRPISVTGVVVDQRGRPIAGATVRPWNRPEGGGRELAELAFQSHLPGKPSGEDGRFELVLPYGQVRSRVKAFVKVGARLRSSEDVWLNVEERDLGGVRIVVDLAGHGK